MKNLRKITLGLLGLVFLLLTFSCEKESIDELYEPENISTEKLSVEDAINKQSHNSGSPCNSIIDLALVIDESGSMLIDGRIDAAKNGAKALVDELNSNSQSALVSYNSGAERPFDLLAMNEAGQSLLMDAIDNLVASGGTNIQGGIIYAAEELTGDETLFNFLDTAPSENDRVDAQKLMILLTDGLPNRYYDEFGVIQTDFSTSAPAQAASDAADIAKVEGIRIIVIVVGNDADELLMKSIASSDDDFYKSDDAAGLELLFEEISGTICTTRVVALDIHPTSCPNPLTRNAKGVIPVSINGSETFDVSEIDVSTITLEGISPVNYSIADVSTFFEVNLEEPLDPYSCTTLAGDGYDDLTLKFDYVELRSVLGELTRGDVFTLQISGQLNDGTDFTGQDIVIVK